MRKTAESHSAMSASGGSADGGSAHGGSAPGGSVATGTDATASYAMARRLAALWPRLDGQLLLPGGPGYDDARRIWNASVDRRPRAIVRCASVFDVSAAVTTARELGL